ncbi:hypothetical protein QYE76_020024 [Lolium multiflorum]|uniref:CCHC-type domain-containing protein n=1 Tax=Lolium multiflorum TaxID=4521 RepID=A0AAD8VNT4_LOLMU|nr:hypothetical protein QYE76_020024 [Lolium multiflorum]
MAFCCLFCSKQLGTSDSSYPARLIVGELESGDVVIWDPHKALRNPTKEIFSELDEINAQGLFCHEASRRPKRRRRGHEAPPQQAAWPGLGRAALCGALVWPPTCPSAYLKPPSRNPSTESHDTENLTETPPPPIPSRGILEIASGTLPERGIISRESAWSPHVKTFCEEGPWPEPPPCPGRSLHPAHGWSLQARYRSRYPAHGWSLQARYRPWYRRAICGSGLVPGRLEPRRYLGRYHGRRLRPPPPSPQHTLRHLLPSLAGSTGHQGPGSTVPPTMEPNMSRGDKDEDEYEEEDWVVSLRDKGESVFKVICKDKIASTHFFEILTTAIESQKLIWMHENTIDKKGALEREYANDVASLKNDLEEEQDTVASLEEQLETLEVSQNEIFAKLTKERDHAKAKLKLLKNEKSKVGVGHDKLVKDLDDLDKAHKALESEHSILTKSYEQLQASYLKEHAMLPSLLDMSCDDACATNSTSCEASILKENVELRAQLDLLTSNYGKLEENHGKLASSHEDLLASHDRLKLAHEAIISKATPCEPHVGTSTTTQNVILPCASPSNSSTHNIAKSCDELSSLPSCSNNEDSTSSSTCVVTNHVEEIKELKAQVTSLKNDLVKSHEGKCKLDTMLSVQQFPNDKSGLGFKSNNKNKSNNNNNNKKGQVQVKDPAKIVCFKCKIEGHHVRSCPLKKKQKGKRPQAQTHIQPQVEEMSLPKKNQANAPIVEKSSEKKEKKRTCYICREKGHISSFCTIGTSSNSITVDDVYSLRKDEGGNVFAKFVGAQSGVKKRTIWVAKPIVTNLLGPNLVGDQQSKT